MLRCFLLGAFAILVARAHAEVGWRSVRGAEMHTFFVDRELSDGMHYAYQFRGDGTFTGFSMGKAIRGTWHVSGNEFCWRQAAFYGVGAAVIGIIAISAYKLTAKNIGKDKLLWAIYLLTAGFTVWTKSESVWLFLGGGVLVWLVRSPPKRWFGRSAAPALAALASQGPSTAAAATSFDWTLLAQLAGFFAKAGAFVFGSGLAIVPFLYGGVVHDHQWLQIYAICGEASSTSCNSRMRTTTRLPHQYGRCRALVQGYLCRCRESSTSRFRHTHLRRPRSVFTRRDSRYWSAAQRFRT